MTLVNSKRMLQDAKINKYAIGAFNVYNIEDTKAVISAAEEINSPVIVMTSGSGIKHTGLNEFAKIISIKAEAASVPICLHLDHAKDFETIAKAIKAGYTSVMFDGSELSYEENVRITKEVVKIANIFNVNVEAEIGVVGNDEDSNEEREIVLSVPIEVEKFCKETEIDSCAIAIGTQHGMQNKEADLDFDRLKSIRDKVRIPLVLHGSSGVKHEDINILSQGYIQKINIGTKLKRTFTDSLRDNLNFNKDIHNHVIFMEMATEAVKEVIIEKMKAMNCVNRA